MTLNETPEILAFAGPNGSGKSTVAPAWKRIGLYDVSDLISTLPLRYPLITRSAVFAVNESSVLSNEEIPSYFFTMLCTMEIP